MRLARLASAAALACACAPAPSGPPAPREAAVPASDPVGPSCEQPPPDALLILLAAAAPAPPAPSAVAPECPRARPPRRAPLRLFPDRTVTPGEAAALSAIQLARAGNGHPDALQTAMQIVREARSRGVARVDLPAGTLGLHVSGDTARLTLSGSF